MFSKETITEITSTAHSLGIEPAMLLAVAEVESAGNAFAVVHGRKEPLIRFEGHYFDRRLTPERQKQAREAGLSSPMAGEVENPRTQEGRWLLLESAARIDRDAAYESVSWGLGQVMGAHWSWLGYGSVGDLVAEARSGPGGQVRLMARFIEKSGLGVALKGKDWAEFARGYNGAGYAKNAYDVKIAAAYERYRDGTGDDLPPQRYDSLLREGDRGDDVLEMQVTLTSLGYPVDPDGIFGPATRRALITFQNDHALDADGLAGPKTRQALALARPLENWFMALWRALRGILSISR